jgi:hypothetical protein
MISSRVGAFFALSGDPVKELTFAEVPKHVKTSSIHGLLAGWANS